MTLYIKIKLISKSVSNIKRSNKNTTSISEKLASDDRSVCNATKEKRTDILFKQVSHVS